MPKLTTEQKEVEEFIRATAVQAQQWQNTVTLGETLEKWINDGNWTYLKAEVLDVIEREAFATIKNPAFDPSNLSQVAQLKALCQTIDLIEGKINQRLNAVKDAREKLRDLERSTPNADDQGESNGN